MMPILLMLTPAVAGVAAFFIRSDGFRRCLWLLAALVHLGLVWSARRLPAAPPAAGWFFIDALSLLFLAVTSVLFLVVSIYIVAQFRRDAPSDEREDHLFFAHAPEPVFTGCLLLFLATMTMVAVSRHLGLIWVGVEATTLASAPLICFHRQPRALEATWKYLMICSVGIALALLGNFLLAAAASGPAGEIAPLLVDRLAQAGGALDGRWLRVAFLFLLVGYGTKMGLAPMHTWLPDAHSEAPSAVSALLSGALLNCAFLALLRVQHVCVAAGQAAYTQGLFIVFGLISLAVAAVFILGQSDYKRLLAYSSVEHMGSLALGGGVGGGAAAGSLLHVINHSLAKGMLFLVAGNILAAYGTKRTDEVRGLLDRLPATGALWLVGFLAITGSPPFGTFISELMILKGAFAQGHPWVGVAFLGLLAVIFVGMATIFLSMTHGPADGGREPARGRIAWRMLAAPVLLGVSVLVLGVYLPPGLQRLLAAIAGGLGGGW